MSFFEQSAQAADTSSSTLAKSGRSAVWNVGTAQGVTDEEGVTLVLVDGPAGAVAEEDVSDDDANVPVECQTIGQPVANGQRVWVASLPNGATVVLGSPGGQPGLLGHASIAGGVANQTFVSTSAKTLVGLEAEVEVLWPDHEISVDVSAQFQSNGANNVLTGRIMRTDEEGNTVEVGRFLRSSAMASGETIQAGVTVKDYAPEPGVYVYYATCQATVTGFRLITNPGTTPLTAAAMDVLDLGALPTSTLRTT